MTASSDHPSCSLSSFLRKLLFIRYFSASSLLLKSLHVVSMACFPTVCMHVFAFSVYGPIQTSIQGHAWIEWLSVHGEGCENRPFGEDRGSYELGSYEFHD
ncbi:hypothetical protein CSUI_008097 [Cystoisospora suis]|uniref:Uncharacterized protein n=1 Tax=Cystoisospora suis TaxID=483139 RepID=A0A2C6KKJ6_9APIC|nr:hypothetical protein CSUI_008097 [Cystoisospora suis]